MHSLRKSCCSGVPVDERRQAPRSNPAFRQTSGDCFVAIAPRNDEFDQQNCPTGQISKNLSSRREDDEKASRLISEIPKFRLPTNPNHFYIDHCPVPQRGVRTSRTRGGMRWTRAARETNAACWRTAKSCGSDAPIVGVKPVRRRAGDGVKQRGHRGEREVSRKTIARGMPGRSGVTVVTTLVCFFVSHARLRVHRAPGIPCALCFLRAERSCKTSGISCRGIAESYLKLEQRHCEEQRDEAIHSSLAAPWIASRSLSSGAHSRDPLARNHRQQ